MSDTVVNNLVLVAVAGASLWWQIGGRDRRAIAAIRERLELLALVEESSALGRKLRREADARSAAYASRVALWPVYLGFALILVGGVVGGVLRSQYPHSDVSWPLAIVDGAGFGAVAGSLILLIASWRDALRD